MIEDPLTLAIATGESKILELKAKLPGKAQIAKTAIAFANTSGGKIVLGVNDRREIIGLGDSDVFELQDRIASMIADSCAPALLPDIYTTNIQGQLVLVIEVFRGSTPPYYLLKEGASTGVYMRLGASTRRAGPEQIQELERQRLNRSFDEEATFEFSLNELDLTPLQSRFAQRGQSLAQTQLLNLKLVTQEQEQCLPTQGLVHLLGKLDHVVVQCARFKGNDMSLFIDRKEYGGDLFSQLEAIEAFLLNHLHLQGEIKGLQRTDTLELPLIALREALINALVHRDYTHRGRNIKVAVFDDRVMILSPGSLPHGLITEQLQHGRSELRNRAIARVFKALGLIEQWGSGFQRMRQTCLDQGLKAPSFKETGAFFEVIFWRASMGKVSDSPEKVSDSPEKVSDSPEKVSDSPEKVSDKERQILEFLKHEGQISSAQVMVLTGLKEARARRVLKEMCDKNWLTRQGKARSTLYTTGAKDV